MNVPFLQTATFTGLISTQNYGTSEDWYRAYLATRNFNRIQFISVPSTVVLNVSGYDTFVISVTGSTTVTYSNFETGKSINVYFVANHNGYLPHTFPSNTVFSELGKDNVIYSFDNYITRILLQNIGNNVINFSSIVKKPVSPYYNGNDEFAGIGLALLDLI
jgi:hypothetical protein